MKPASEWDLDYILGLPEGEFDWVEFKGRKAIDVSVPGCIKLEDELAKQLSAFANSGGGTLVYGITNPNGQPKAVDDGGVKITCKQPNIREWLEDIIPNMVEFPLKKFNVYALTKTSGAPALADDRCVLVVDIADSEDAPHQSTRDKLYYARVAGKSRPLGHRLITDIFFRRQHPVIDVEFHFESETYVPQSALPFPRSTKPVREVQLIAKAVNGGKLYAKHVHFTAWLPATILGTDQWRLEGLVKIEEGYYTLQKRDNRRRDVIGQDPMMGTRYGLPWLDPILPTEARAWSFKCSPSLRPENMPDESLIFEVNADNAPTNRRTLRLRDLPFELRDQHKPEELDTEK